MLELFRLLLICLCTNLCVCVTFNRTSVFEGYASCFEFHFSNNFVAGQRVVTSYRTTGNVFITVIYSNTIVIHSSYLNRTNCTADLSKRWLSFCIHNITLNDAGNYTTVALSETYIYELEVLVPLLMVDLNPDQDIVLKESRSQLFRCFARSIPLASITWYIDESPITPSASNYSVDSVESYLVYTGNRSDHNKFLFCSANNGSYTVTSSRLHFNIIYAPLLNPSITQIPTGGIITGNNVTLTCSSSGGNPLPVLSWNCSSDQQQNNTSDREASYSVSFTVNRNDDNKICACNATHPIDTFQQIVTTRLVVYYAPDDNLSVTQYPTEAIAQQNVTLTCKVSGGNPIAILSWNCTGITVNKTIGDTASNSVTFIANKSDNKRVCLCSASHIVTSYRPQLQYTLAVIFPPDEPLLIENGDQSVVFYENTTATLVCRISGGNPLATLQFLCGNVRGQNTSDPKAAVSVLQLQPNRTLNGKCCECVATHRLLNVTTHLKLNVYFPPENPVLNSFPKQPLLEGLPVDIYCNATLGNPPNTSYEWFIDGRLQPNQTNNVFQFRNVTKEDNLLHLQCKIRNNFTDHMNVTRQSKDEIIIVHYYPTFKMPVGAVTVNETRPLLQTCRADGNPLPNVQWFFRNTSVSLNQLNLTTLNITSIERSNAGLYECRAIVLSNHGQLERSFTLEVTVNYAPDIQIEVSSNNIEVAGNVTLTCVPKGIPQLYTLIGWQHKYQNIVVRNSKTLSNIQTEDGRKLVLTKLTYQDIGAYSCSASNGIAGKNGILEQENTTYISVQGPPIIHETEINSAIFTTENGNNLTAKFEFYTYPNITGIEWFNNKSQPIHPSNSASISLTAKTLLMDIYGTMVDVTDFSYETSLLLCHFQKKDEGNYMLLIDNGFRKTNVSFRVQISGPPEPPLNITQVGQSDTSVVLSWIPGFDGGHLQTFNVVYYVLGLPDTFVHRMTLDNKNKTQYLTITDLQPSTTYVFIVFASNVKGNSSLNETTCCLPFNVTTDSSTMLTPPYNSALTTGLAAGISTSTTVILCVVIAVIVRRRIYSKQKGTNTETNIRSRLTELGSNEDENGLKDNILYETAGPRLTTSKTETVDEYAVVRKPGNKSNGNLDTQILETSLYTGVKKQKDNGAANINKTTNQQCNRNKDVYENVFKDTKHNGEVSQKNLNQNGLQYAELVFCPSPNGPTYVIHGLDDRTEYAEVDTTQKIDPLPESDDEQDTQVLNS